MANKTTSDSKAINQTYEASPKSRKTVRSVQLLTALQNIAPKVTFVEGQRFYWSAPKQTVTYVADTLSTPQGTWGLLHETGHALLDHRDYDSDFGLLQLEIAAWEKAKELAPLVVTTIDESHIQDCLDTYRDWLHRRATCPTCGIVCLEREPRVYVCHNCNARWSVSAARFCRPYRRIG